MNVLVVNAGSSSMKLSVLDPDERLVAGFDDLDEALEQAGSLDVGAVGHRVVQGGAVVLEPTVADDDVVGQLRDLTSLAPLHQPPALDALDRTRSALPDVPQVVCPDTAFHAGLPRAARELPLPADWRDRYGLRRFGAHGLSHSWVSRRATEHVPDASRVVVAHLGSGASLCAVQDGRSIDTTMGFTPLDGLVMATRSGSVDPGLVLWLLDQDGLGVAEVREGLEHQSGLVGLAGTSDLAEVLRRADEGEDQATGALEVYLRQLRAELAAMVAALGGVDVLAFAGGVGEQSPPLRQRAVAGLAHLGLALDTDADDAATGVEDVVEVTGSGSAARVLVVAAREDLEIARAVRRVTTG